ncbi:MAG TPA: hypothetical protein VE623_14730 [Acidimicrobiales bacterium]|jgi:hypothetical protein|nr:hypothetical protein [Acidimicrobiales bacterium]
MAQSTGHWTIAAAMRPHQVFGEADPHVTLSTAIMSVSIAFHDDVDVTQWCSTPTTRPTPAAARPR